ncbi:hypothetical protein BD626DRAFT_523456 [Schizophyllum amplum]|uniref:Uncharacterized protein n=1 Tax=Schizophyllum amplum TaxID=97359 RepID=A0A550BT18_9AGAR|nr:hypothetical protein BD626DRAFT_523456 [Auriculariopsis ampla]
MSPPKSALARTDTTPHTEGFVSASEKISTSERYSPQLGIRIKNINAESALRRQVAVECAAPVHRLPPELLSEIFVHLTESNLLGYNSQKEGRNYAAHLIATTVACVCVSWRAAALATPRLWSRIHVDEQTRHLDAYVRTCISRSRKHGLEIVCTAARHLPAVIAGILPHAPRWESISLGGFFKDFCSIAPGHHFARLRDASLSINSLVDNEAGTFEFLANAPSLRQVRLNAMETIYHEPTKLPSSWQLARLHLDLDDICHLRPLVATLAQYQATLEDLICAFDDDIRSSTLEGVIDPIQLPVLGSIELSRHAFMLFSYLNAPKISEIIFIDTEARNGLPYGRLLTFLTLPSSPLTHLRRLRLMETYHAFDEETSEGLLRCLELMDELQELDVSCSAQSTFAFGYPDWMGEDMSLTLWTGLTVREGRRPVLPNLLVLRLYLGTEWLTDQQRREQHDSLTVMALSRKRARVVQGRQVVALERVEVDRGRDSSILSRLSVTG